MKNEDNFKDELMKIIKEEHDFSNSLINSIINLEQEKFNQIIETKLEKKKSKNIKKELPESAESISRDLKKGIVHDLFSLIIHSEFKKENIILYMDIISSQIRPELLLITLWSQNEKEIVYSLLEKKSIPIEKKIIDIFYELFSNKIDTYKADMPLGIKERKEYIENLKNELVLASRFLSLNKELKTKMKKGDLRDRPIPKI